MDTPEFAPGGAAQASETSSVAQQGAPGSTFPPAQGQEQTATQSPPAPVDLTQFPEFRRYQSAADQRIAAAERAAQQMQAQFQQMQAQMQQQQREQYYAAQLQQDRTPQEQAAVQLQYQRQMIQEQAQQVEAQRQEVEAQQFYAEQQRNLDGWTAVYVNKWHIPPDALRAFDQKAAEYAQGDPYEFHARRDYFVKEFMHARETGTLPPGLGGQSQARMNQPPGVARPNSTAGPGSTLQALEQRAMRGGSPADWDALYNRMRMVRNRYG